MPGEALHETDEVHPPPPRLAIEDVPAKPRQHGLRDTHSYPLCSRGKTADGRFAGSVRVPTAVAWQVYPSLEIRAANSWPALTLDLDGREGTERLWDRVEHDEICVPNWVVTRSRGGVTGGSHAVWCLEKPVHRGAYARARPLRLLASVSEYFAEALGADPGYAGVLTHNPMSRPQGRTLTTTWRRFEPYPLAELRERLPDTWLRDRTRFSAQAQRELRTALGRNCLIFELCMRWAGSEWNLGQAVLDEAEALNAAFLEPLDESEVLSIARSVERYRAEWIARGQFYTAEERAEYGRQRQAAGVRARRERNRERDDRIVEARRSGMSLREIARAVGVTKDVVWRVLQRRAHECIGRERRTSGEQSRRQADGSARPFSRDDRIAAGLEAGMSLGEIARTVGVTTDDIWQVVWKSQPLWLQGNPMVEWVRPWERLGISRATFYRRQQGLRLRK